MKRLLVGILVFWALIAQGALAQSARDVVWVQVEAQPNLTAATERAQSYAANLPDVNGFSLGGGWYGIALGPYARSDAEQVLRVYRAEGFVPRDSFIAESRSFRQQFWPIGANVLNRGVVQPPANVAPAAPETGTAEVTPAPQITPSDETPAEARRSERLLSADERKELQVALQWAGFYSSTIDGAFGRGTRSSMSAWQTANGFEPTGVLTTLQRAALFAQYNAVLEGLDLKTVQDTRAGIEIALPMGVVVFDKYAAPFAQYASTGDIDATVLLISQQGSQDTLYGLYDIMQTLEIVPLNGPRERNTNSFTLIGQNDRFISETRARLDDGQIKGFTLIWPAGDEERRTRLLNEMQKSFVRLDGVLDDAAGDDGTQAIDLVAGLQVRKPRLSRSGFYVDAQGSVATTSEAVQSCTRITLDDEYEARVTAQDEATGVAILTPVESLAPPKVASLSPTQPRLQSEIAVSGYSFEGVLSAPSITFGTLADLRGLRGEDSLSRLSLEHLPGDAGGPVLDTGGNVLGMLLPRAEGSQQLPADVSFALDSDALFAALERMGVNARKSDQTEDLPPQDITRMGLGLTVLVSCWD